ncbi:histidine phosphatase family protein [Thermoflavimicrobium dichotomicum]|uniref:Alpha-ribazole phosphatase/probable phosphoglycerate mutase n=1 Tax=Thermoflavimicrobium dichotomicum TaxID=46223 RepID=A0A1I3MLE1_9BACL|nr:histidine phosphatase family protein [Thermoflavimicrobium dichotomicum]SFI97789.1 alpha-ribazole phosphatase/probable phosphoglycerate mutase [Thermoflavimicrobium dichotomicum]
MVTTVDLIRHGETIWNREKRFQGHTDIPLSEEGRKQAEGLAKYLVQERISAIYSSDLCRAFNTAQAIAQVHSLPVKTSVYLRERHMGDWAGLTLDEVQNRYPDWEEVMIHGGVYGIEETKQMARRVMFELERLVQKHRGEHICVVSHGGCIHAVLGEVTQGQHDRKDVRIENTSVTRLHFDEEDGWQIVFVNQMPHLLKKGR